MQDNNDNDWGKKYGYHVLEELKEQKRVDEAQAQAIRDLEMAMVRLKARIGAWGAGGAAGGGALVIFLKEVIFPLLKK